MTDNPDPRVGAALRDYYTQREQWRAEPRRTNYVAPAPETAWEYAARVTARYEAHMAMQERLRQDEDDERKYGRGFDGGDAA